MMEKRRDDEHGQWRDEYEAMLRALPRGVPDDNAADRIVERLRADGLLRAAPRHRALLRWRPALAAAAAALLFVGGVAVGRSSAPAPVQVTGETTPMELQRAASAYLAALQALQDPSVSPVGRQTGVEIGMNTLEFAASELVRAAPDDPLAGELARAIHVSRNRTLPDGGSRRRHIVWF